MEIACNVITLTKFYLLAINLKPTSLCIPMNNQVSLPDKLPAVPEIVKISPQCIESMMRYSLSYIDRLFIV